MNTILLLETNGMFWNNTQNSINYFNNEFKPMEFEISAMNFTGNLTGSSVEIRMIFSETINSPAIISELLMGQKAILRRLSSKGNIGGDTIILSGKICAFSTKTTEFTIIIQDETYKFKEPVLQRYTKKCKAIFCSKQCGLNAGNFSTNKEIIEVKKSSVILKNTPPIAFYTNGIATISNTNFTKSLQIRDITDSEVFFFENIPSFVKVGNNISILQACDKTFAMCGKYANQKNFRGEIVI